LAARGAVVVGLTIIHPTSIAPDGIRYSWMAAQLAAGRATHWDPYYNDLYHQVCS